MSPCPPSSRRPLRTPWVMVAVAATLASWPSCDAIAADEPTPDSELPLSRFSAPGDDEPDAPRRSYRRPQPAEAASPGTFPPLPLLNQPSFSFSFTVNGATTGSVRRSAPPLQVDTTHTVAGLARMRLDAALPPEFRVEPAVSCRPPSSWAHSLLPCPPRGTRSSGVVATIDDHAGPVHRAVLGPDGAIVATTDNHPGVRLSDCRTGHAIGRLLGHHGKICLAFDPGGGRLVTGAADGRVQCWTLDPPAPEKTLVSEWTGLVDLAFSPDGGRLAVADFQGGIRILDPVDGIVLAVIESGFTDGSRLAFSPDGAMLAFVSGGGAPRLGLWRLDTLKPVPLDDSAVGCVELAFHPKGRSIAAIRRDSVLEWDTSTGELLHTYPCGNVVRGLAYLDEGRRLVTGDAGHSLRTWDTANGRPVGSIATSDGPIERLAVSRDGALLVTAHPSGTLVFRDPSTAAEVARVAALPRTYWRPCDCVLDSLTISADDSRVACHRGCTAASVVDARAVTTRLATRKNAAIDPGGDRNPSPQATASHTSPYDAVERAINGSVAYSNVPNDRWTAYGSSNATDWLAIDFGTRRRVASVGLALYDDNGGVRTPERFHVEVWQNGAWTPAIGETHTPARPLGNAINDARFEPVETSKLRIVFTHRPGSSSGVSEVFVWDD